MNFHMRALLRKAAPHIAFEVSYEEDPSYRWDGDGPDPANEGYAAYNVTVKASAIIEGMLREQSDNLGGVYEPWGPQGPRNPDPDIGGYLPQMIEQAVTDLKEAVHDRPRWLDKECAAVVKAVKKYRAQRP